MLSVIVLSFCIGNFRDLLRGVNTSTRSLGDVIVGADSKPVRRLADLIDQLEQIGIGRKVQLKVNRGGSTTSVEVEVIDIGRTH